MNQVYMWKPLWYWLGAVMTGIVVYLSLMPSPPQLDMTAGDKLQHLAAYSVLGFWFAMLALENWRQLCLAVGPLIGLGLVLEFIQGMTGYRTFDIGDMLANSLGVVSGSALARTRLGRALFWLERLLRAS
jgi:VanZ family protein